MDRIIVGRCERMNIVINTCFYCNVRAQSALFAVRQFYKLSGTIGTAGQGCQIETFISIRNPNYRFNKGKNSDIAVF